MHPFSLIIKKAIIKKYRDEIAQGKIPKHEPEKTKGRKRKPVSEKFNADIKKILDGEGKPLSAGTLDI